MTLSVTKKPDETWRQCVERYAKPHGLDGECLELFEEQVAIGEPEDKAAFAALYEWDCTDYLGDVTPLRAKATP
jgi:hypothetical protein